MSDDPKLPYFFDPRWLLVVASTALAAVLFAAARILWS